MYAWRIKKNGINCYGYKNNVCIHVEHEFISRYVVTPANIHDIQTLQMILDSEDQLIMFVQILPIQTSAFKSC